MKKILILTLSIFFLVSCKSSESKEDLLFKKYDTAYEELLSNDKFEVNSQYYDVEVATNLSSDNKYRVDIIIDNPKVAMYNIMVIAEVNSLGYKQFDEVIPSLGIVDQYKYHLVPNQVNKKEDFYEGLVLSQISKDGSGDVILFITWTNYSSTETFSEFIKVEYDIDNDKNLDDNNENLEDENENVEDDN